MCNVCLICRFNFDKSSIVRFRDKNVICNNIELTNENITYIKFPSFFFSFSFLARKLYFEKGYTNKIITDIKTNSKYNLLKYYSITCLSSHPLNGLT